MRGDELSNFLERKRKTETDFQIVGIGKIVLGVLIRNAAGDDSKIGAVIFEYI